VASRQAAAAKATAAAVAAAAVKREVVGRMRCLTGDWSEARDRKPLIPDVCPSQNVVEAHPRQRSDRAHDAPPEAELPPLKGTCSHHPTNRDAPPEAYKNLPDFSSKMSSSRDTSTSKDITLTQQCMSKAQTIKANAA